jgi:16S rRNA (guanine527-N7)-methyltransferase
MTPPSAQPESDQVEPVPPAAASLFAQRLPDAIAYADLLVSAGVARGLIGPHEAARIWTRHILNSAVVAELIPAAARVVDVGSGAGLPGIALALARPDLQIALLDPLQRRTRFLDEVVEALGLDERVRVVRGRAEEPAIRRTVGGATTVVARAVAPLDRLVGWCLPLLEPGGWLLALKGASASDELAEHAAAVHRAGAVHVEVTTCGHGVVDPVTAVIRMRRRTKDTDTR